MGEKYQFIDRRITSTPEEQGWMLQAISKRAQGFMSDEDWACFMKMLKERFPETK